MTGAELPALLAGWAPGAVETTETITAEPAVGLAGLLDAEPPVTGPGDVIPPLWHWLYFLDRPAQRELGPDGHPVVGGFLPPIPRVRRMYAGARVSYLAPIRCGDQVTRRSELADWRVSHGRTGELLFVTVRHTFSRGGLPLATEEQDLVYRGGPPSEAAPAPRFAPVPQSASPSAAAAPAGGGGSAQVTPVSETDWELRVVSDPVLLFRFSALTYNAHRIHYDAEYATAVEGHPGLVVQGPLLAIFCLELPRRQLPGRRIRELSFRARSPVYVGQAFTVAGGLSDGDCDMRVTAPGATVAMTAQGRLASGEPAAGGKKEL